MLREGIQAQYEPAPAPTPIVGRTAKRKASYASAIGERRAWRDRLDLSAAAGA
jgi:hypothetical protein